MRKLITIVFIALTSSLVGQIYMSPSGDDVTGDGSISNPYETLPEAITHLTDENDTLFIRGGTYESLARTIYDPTTGDGVSGSYGDPIVIMGYPGEWPIFDCSRHIETYGYLTGVYNAWLLIENAQYIKLKDIEVKNVFQLDSVATGAIGTSYAANLTFEHIIMHNIGQRGFYVQGGAWNDHFGSSNALWDYDTTRFINCDVYDLCDSLSSSSGGAPGNSADAWKTIHYKNNYVSWENCRAWNYTDDGWDPSAIGGGTFVFNNCWSMPGSKYVDVPAGWDNERNGFKFSRKYLTDEKQIMATNCVAMFGNTGFYELGDTHPSNGIMYNNTAYKNGINFGVANEESNTIFRNNIAWRATDSTATDVPYECAFTDAPYLLESHNTWDKRETYPGWRYTDTVSVTDADFVTVDSATLVSLFTAPRNADGSLPPFPLQLAEGSDLIDAGTQIPTSDGVDFTFTFDGLAPDIGAGDVVKVLSGTPAPPTPASIIRHLGSGGKVYYFNGKYLKN